MLTRRVEEISKLIPFTEISLDDEQVVTTWISAADAGCRRNGELDPRSPNGAFFRESLPYPLPPSRSHHRALGVSRCSNFLTTFKRIAGPPPSEFRRRLASR